MKRIGKHSWFTSLLIGMIYMFTIGCVDEIELEGTGGGGGQLVIQGQLFRNCPSTIRVRISRTADFAVRSFPTAVEGAEVMLLDVRGGKMFIAEIEPGIYQSQIPDDMPDISIETGEKYAIQVTTSEGATYESSYEELHPVPLADSISIEVVSKEVLDLQGELETKQFMQFFVHTPVQAVGEEAKSRFRWIFENVYRVDEVFVPGPGPGPQTCFISRGLNLDKVVVFNGNESNSTSLNKFLIVEDEIDFRYGRGYLLRVSQQSLGKDAFSYWDQVSKAVSLSGGLFEAVPGEITGNISNISDANEVVYGYFYASEEQIITRFVSPDEAGRPTDFCSLSLFSGEPICKSCITIPFSTKEIPDGWEQ